MLFKELGLSAELLRAVEQKGYETPTPVQLQSIPVILEGRDVLAGAQTGTGKTAGFTLPMLQRLAAPRTGPRGVRALILTPTRELAAQVHQSVRDYGRNLRFHSAEIYGGVNARPQIAKLQRGVDIVIATPGRLLDLMQQRAVDLRHVEICVLDEADRMLDMGFIRDIRKILGQLPRRRQNLLFSATFSNEIRKLAQEFLHDPAEIQVTPRNSTVDRVSQVIHPVDKSRKRELLSELIGKGNWRQVLVFTRTKHGADRLVKQLAIDGLQAMAIHGNKSQNARQRALSEFKRGNVRVLVATDIAARGLDIERLPHVVNFELPNVPEDYLHRIGRTARAGQDGHALSLVCIDERKLLDDIEKLLNTRIAVEVIAGYQPDPRIKAEPILMGRQKQHAARPRSGTHQRRAGQQQRSGRSRRAG